MSIFGDPVMLATEPDMLTFLHLPEEAEARRTAILLCPPFGWAAQCSYRPLRIWAASLARAGYPVMRATPPGSGDSSGEADDADQLGSWRRTVPVTAAWLRERTRADHVVALGIGLGGMLAWLAACDGAPIDDLILWAVPARGRALVRELRSRSALIARHDEIAPEPDGGSQPSEPVPAEDGLNLIGFRISEQTAEALSSVRLDEHSPPMPDERRVLLLSRDSLPVDRALHDHLARLGVIVETRQTRDYDQLIADPLQARAPSATMALTLDWLERGTDEGPSRRSRSTASIAAQADVLRAGSGSVRETPLRVAGVHGDLFGIVAAPAACRPAPLAVVWLGAGPLPHTGPNRAWVRAARRWAARGVPTVRVDLSGIGESGGDDHRLLCDDSLYAPWRVDDARAVLDHLSAVGLADRFVLGGLCSGAYTSLHAALADDRVRGLLLINLVLISYSEALIVQRGRRAQLDAGLPARRHAHVNVALPAKAMKYIRPDRAWGLLTRSEERADHKRALTALDRLLARDVQTLLLLGDREPLLAQFGRHGLLDGIGRWPNLTLERLPSSDHMLRESSVQRRMHQLLDAALERVLRAEDPESADSYATA